MAGNPLDYVYNGQQKPNTKKSPLLPTGSSGIGSAAPGAYVEKPAPLPPLPPTTPAPVPLQGGKVSYNPTTAPFGLNMSGPGEQEQMWNNNQSMWFDSPSLDWMDQQLPQFQDPWQGENVNSQLLGSIAQPGAGQQYWQGIQGQGNTQVENRVSGGYNGPNHALQAFNQTNAAMPGSLQPQFDAYYDRMSQKAMGNVNAQGASRGAYGSNASLNNSIGAGLDVEAQRAAAATQFSLDDSANNRAWHDSLGTQGRNADLSATDAFGQNIEASKFGLDRTKTLGDLAFRSEEMDFNKNKEKGRMAFDIDDHKATRLGAGISTALGSHNAHQGQLKDAYSAAGESQAAREGRINKLHDQLTGFSKDVQDFVTNNYSAIIGADGQIDDAALEAMIAKTADERGYDQYETERLYRDAKAAADVAIGAATAGASKGK